MKENGSIKKEASIAAVAMVGATVLVGFTASYVTVKHKKYILSEIGSRI